MRVARLLQERYTTQTLQGTNALCAWRFLFGLDLGHSALHPSPAQRFSGAHRGRGELSQQLYIPLQDPDDLP